MSDELGERPDTGIYRTEDSYMPRYRRMVDADVTFNIRWAINTLWAPYGVAGYRRSSLPSLRGFEVPTVSLSNRKGEEALTPQGRPYIKGRIVKEDLESFLRVVNYGVVKQNGRSGNGEPKYLWHIPDYREVLAFVAEAQLHVTVEYSDSLWSQLYTMQRRYEMAERVGYEDGLSPPLVS